MSGTVKMHPRDAGQKEWLVIESSMSRGVFVSDTPEAQAKGYIPRDVVEKLLGREIEDGRTMWFSREEGEKMRAHPEWSNTQPPGTSVPPVSKEVE